ncbi:MAG TPA: adenylosuccinate synthase [Polyangiaceae bacterium LLY-WYZ-15_(1-7)]|nr:adenylosuccinate synthase [Sandaracinus sp.]HJL04597.1 adenylosuccinate synthase [Polyangiaceae bacterium LLY-WYZ-15_(1-7)]HJL07379.1 adenylosuccinate synthase [Polyangiaceae bacterium LLY-WYZ-15_(1-7)]HJL23161.1 adenylosuccinate synthase [Polyangiaceae bacterium LLY-WYZ-15_(1-7)]HJL29456.1 adenylosuccinate synthase [Polyangiaceae bacterium LLY-WYZ-15_(1-7)]
MPAIVVVGAQWGDEGKGKVVDLLSPHADVVVRYAGGANAGHTLVVKGEKLVLHLIPSGILHEGCECIVGQGCVADPETLVEEIDALEARGVSTAGRLWIADRTHVVMPQHKLVDGLREAADGKIGTTKRGIGMAYEDKVGRRGVRVGDLIRPGLAEKVGANLAAWEPRVKALGGELPSAEEIARGLRALGERLESYVADGAGRVAEALAAEKKVLLEGAQGTMLDVDHGTYPFVTSSNAISGGACTGAGVGPTQIRKVIGITKAYTTRVGGGPFPTELEDAAGEKLRAAGAEFGATTGRPRRCGWLDGPALRYAVQVNGMTSIALTKLDVLAAVDAIDVCTGYRLDGEVLAQPPFDAMSRVEPVYETSEGFPGAELGPCREREALPEAARRYVDRIAELVGCPIDIISVGPDREETIGLSDPFAG